MEKQNFDLKEFKRTLSAKIAVYIEAKQQRLKELEAEQQEAEEQQRKNNRRKFTTA